MAKTLDEFFESHEATKLLVQNLEANMSQFFELSKEDKKTLMRLNLIMIRQCLEDFGAE